MHGEVINPKDGDPDAVVPGLMAPRRADVRLGHGATGLGLQLADRSGGVRPRAAHRSPS